MSDVNLIAMFVVRVCGFQDFNLALEKSVFPPMNQDDKKIPGKYIASPLNSTGDVKSTREVNNHLDYSL